MLFNAIIEDHVYELNVPDALLAQAGGYFDRLDSDMDAGWQMGREWVDSPDRLQRCQIVADKLLTALESENQKLGMLMAGYILARLPGVASVELDVQGEIQNNAFTMSDVGAAPPPVDPSPARAGMSKLDAMSRAGEEVTQVFKVGRGFRFSVLDTASGGWVDSPIAATEQEAARLRQEAFKSRYEALLSGRRG